MALPPPPPFQRLSSRVVSILGLNPSPFTLHGTNTYLVGTGPSRLLIDAGDGCECAEPFVQNLRAAMATTGCRSIAQIVATHHHHDHTGGLRAVREAFGRELRVSKWLPAASAAAAPADEELLAPAFGGAYHALAHGDELAVEGATLRVLHTPGHTPDSISLLLLEENSIFCGDTVLGAGSSVFGDLGAYMRSLRELQRLRPAALYCGHGPAHAADGAAARLLQQYIAHRTARIEQVRAALAARAGPGATADELVGDIYAGELFVAAADAVLLAAAASNTEKVLLALREDGAAVERGERWYSVIKAGL